MGISRSATVIAAYLMLSRQIPVQKAIAIIKRGRPQIQPNYGFVKSLYAFEACHYSVSSTDATYRAWKRRHRQDVTCFLNSLSDTTAIIPEKLSLSSDFPSDPEQAACLVSDLGFTHCISLSPSAAFPANIGLKYNHIEIPQCNKAGLLLALPSICKNIQDASDNRGRILIHCLTESTAAIVACAYLMWSRHFSYNQAYKTLHDALPLFNPTDNFTQLLELYAACNCSPSSDHPALQDWLGIGYPSNSFSSSQPSGSFAIQSSPTRRALGTVLPTPPTKQYSKTGGQVNHSLSLLRPVVLDG
jgi:dual specificity phosphatase 12